MDDGDTVCLPTGHLATPTLQEISCGLGRLEKKPSDVSNKSGFMLIKLGPNFTTDCPR